MAAALQKTIYFGSFVHCETLTTLDVCTSGIIGVDEHGKIAFICRDIKGRQYPINEGWEEAKIVRIQDYGFFFPGFIDTHIHASQYPNAGVFGKSTLLDWLNTYTFPLESSFANLENAARIYNRVVARTLSHGTTTACYYATIHVAATNLLADICASRGQRAFVGRVCMDQLSPDHYRDESPAAALRDTEACIAHIERLHADSGARGRDALVHPILTPRFAPSCSSETLGALGALLQQHDPAVSGGSDNSDLHLLCQTHISENAAEIALVRELFPAHASYAAVYDAHGLLTPRTVLAHAVHLGADEVALCAARGAKISHCPASNTALTSGAARVRGLLDAGLTVGLGTDVSGGYTPSVLAEAREAIFVSRHVAMADGDAAKLSVEEALYLATRGGARVVGLEDRVGAFEVGMDWDAQMVALPRVGDRVGLDPRAGLVELFGDEGWDEKIAKWVYTGDDRNTAAVWVKGRLVHSTEAFQP